MWSVSVVQDEPADEVEKIVKALESKPFADKCTHKTYPNMYVPPLFI